MFGRILVSRRSIDEYYATKTYTTYTSAYTKPTATATSSAASSAA
jgi:hypothetical protein